MKIPTQRDENNTPVWKVDQSSDRGFAVMATRNIHFDKKGRASLSNRTINVFDTNNDASFKNPIAFHITGGSLAKTAGTNNGPYSVAINDATPSISADGLSNQPSLSQNSSGVFFNSKWFVSETGDLNSLSGSTWTDEVVTLTSGVRHPLCVHQGNNSLLVGNGPQVKQYNTGISETTNLTIPAGVEVVGIAYNRNLACLITWESDGHQANAYIWDGATAAANFAYPLGTSRAHFVYPYGDTFVILTGLGELLFWNNSGLERLAALPLFYTSAILCDINDRANVAHDTSVMVDGDKLLFNIASTADSKGSEPSRYNPDTPSGIWCYQKGVGLYHRHAPSSAKLLSKTISTANVNTTTDVLTASATVPDTGTPCVYAADSATITPLSINTTYYVINTSSTTFKLATTRANALAGTAIDLTAVTAASNFDFLFFPESDFGQLHSDDYAGGLVNLGPAEANTSSSFFSIFEKYGYGFNAVKDHFVGTSVDTFGFVMDRSENRGWIKFQKFYSEDITGVLSRIFVKARHLYTEHDKVLVKYRKSEDPNMPVIAITSGEEATWTSSTTFTTTKDLSNVKTQVDAGNYYQIEFLQGAGAGYLAHITAISYSAPTYTVTIDETIRNIAVSDTCYFRIDDFLKLETKNKETAITSASDPNYSVFPISKSSSWVQIMIELRGLAGVAIEELEIPNIGDTPAV